MVVVGASTMTAWAVEQLRRVGAEVVVVDPRVRLIAETRRKNDRADARVLAELARTAALPPPLTLPSEQARVLRARLVVRRGFVAQRSAILCRPGSLLRSVGIRISTRGLQRPGQWDKLLRRRDLPQWLVCLLRSLREAVEVVERMIDTDVALRMKKHPLGPWARRLIYRRGRKVAVVALARRMLCMAFANGMERSLRPADYSLSMPN